MIVSTAHSLHFLNIEDYSLEQIKQDYSIPIGSDQVLKPVLLEFKDEDEWTAWTTRDDNVLHIELRKVSNILLIAPLSANTMGKLANGLCDNLLTSVSRCWDVKSKSKPFIVAPAMNTMMYEHPITE